LSLQAGAELCEILREPEHAARAAAASKRAAAFRRAPSPSKQANALLVLAGTANAAETNRSILSRDPNNGLSTFYGYYILQARAQAGDYQGCLDLIRTYWGGMLDRGATTFWEGFELDWTKGSSRIDELPQAGQKDLHADFGDYCYVGLRHSLCHGWAAGPTAWLSEHVLGIAPEKPGFESIRVTPHLGDLQWAEGAVPTPHGLLRVRHEKKGGKVSTEIDAPSDVKKRIRK
ncbi:MAG: glycoside hydrolase family 78, partial [Armatimonadetes bacterium]|nr:glycoside hydrolase family 78 [Armatimonadota bacterium]